jgi:glycosyltransferase involved in cell wall biosynthesis
MILQVLAPFSNQGGFGTHARGFTSALESRHRVHRVDISEGAVAPASASPLDPDAVIVMAPPNYSIIRRLAPVVFYSVWETDRLPLPYCRNLDFADQIWTPTRWGASVLANSGVNALKIRTVPEGVDAAIFRPGPSRDGAHRTFEFLFVGKWEERKGIQILLSAFTSEFQPSEPVRLTLHCGHDRILGFSVDDLVSQQLAGSHTVSRIRISPRLDQTDLTSLMQAADAFVLPTRGEGWGLPILEAMACGLPVIVTNHGGHLEFCNERNAHLINVKSMVEARDPHFFPPPIDWGCWAEPDIRHLQQIMRSVVSDPQPSASKSNQALCDAHNKWTWERAAVIANDHLERLIGALT